MAKKDYTVAVHSAGFDPIDELVRRGKVRRYFEEKRALSQREGVGILFGGLLSLLFGTVVFPLLFRNADMNPLAIKLSCGLLIVGGLVFLVKGIFDIKKEAANPLQPVSDEVIDSCLRYDMEGISERSKLFLMEQMPGLIIREEELRQMPAFFLKGPEEFTYNTNLPLGCKRGADDVIRVSNYAVMALYFGETQIYIYTCIYNMRDGKVKYEHTYECAYEMIAGGAFRDVRKESVTNQNSDAIKRVKSFILTAKEGDPQSLSVDVVDYDILDQFQGKANREDQETVQLVLEKIKSVTR